MVMKAKYLGSDDPTENTVCEFGGIEFEKGRFKTIPDELAAKLDGNPMFEVSDK
jgi:hypothetical protein